MSDHDPDLSRLYRKASDDLPASKLDVSIRDAAHQAVARSGYRTMGWMWPLASVATLVLGVGLLVQLAPEALQEPTPMIVLEPPVSRMAPARPAQLVEPVVVPAVTPVVRMPSLDDPVETKSMSEPVRDAEVIHEPAQMVAPQAVLPDVVNKPSAAPAVTKPETPVQSGKREHSQRHAEERDERLEQRRKTLLRREVAEQKRVQETRKRLAAPVKKMSPGSTPSSGMVLEDAPLMLQRSAPVFDAAAPLSAPVVMPESLEEWLEKLKGQPELHWQQAIMWLRDQGRVDEAEQLEAVMNKRFNPA